MGGSSLLRERQGSTKHEQAQKLQAFNQSNTLNLFCFSDLAPMAFHIVTNSAMFIWEEDDDLHLGRINNHHIDMSSHMNCILFFFLC